ncbi:hypothetical protein [uncultured Mediterranean phage uvMED]|nr:hypothetical protein [uncultured Mediterranean phage uvMED]
MIKIHKTTLVGFKQIVDAFQSPKAKSTKDTINIGIKELEKHLSPMAVKLLMDIDIDTLKKAKI